MNVSTRREWFHRYSPRNGGDLAEVSADLHNQILNLWASGIPKSQISVRMGVHVGTIRKAVRAARNNQDPRGFAKAKPLMVVCGRYESVLDLYQEQWVIRGLAEEFGVHFTKVEQAIRKLSNAVKAETQSKVSNDGQQ
jgi:transposase